MDKKDQQVKELQQKLDEAVNNWKRALADYQNLERRMQEQKENWIQFASERLLHQLLPVLDNLEKAGAHLKDPGLDIAVKQLRDVLKNEGLEEIEAMGKEFDPRVHESVDVEEGDKENMISEVYAKGYRLKDKVIRPSKVKVIKKKIDQKAEDQTKEAGSAGDYV